MNRGQDRPQKDRKRQVRCSGRTPELRSLEPDSWNGSASLCAGKRQRNWWSVPRAIVRPEAARCSPRATRYRPRASAWAANGESTRRLGKDFDMHPDRTRGEDPFDSFRPLDQTNALALQILLDADIERPPLRVEPVQVDVEQGRS